MVGSHSRISHSAEGKVVRGDVRDDIIHAAPTVLQAVHHALFDSPVCGEEVERQWVRALLNEAVGLVNILYREDGKQGPEDLLLHHWGAGGDSI